MTDIKKQDGEKGDLKSDYKFGRSASRSRVRIKFPLNGATVPSQWVYDKTKKAWEEKKSDAVYINVLASTATAFRLEEEIDGAPDNRVSSKVWKVKVLVTKSTVKAGSNGGKPSGKPAEYTYFNLPVPSWLNVWDFAKSVVFYLNTKEQLVDADGKADNEGQIIAFVSPDGKTYGAKILVELAKKSEKVVQPEKANQ